jgi:hypothetical protein
MPPLNVYREGITLEEFQHFLKKEQEEPFADELEAVKDHVMSYVENSSRAARGYVLSKQEV